MKLSKEFIANVRMLAKYRGYVHIEETYGVSTFAEQARREYKEKYGFELIDSFHLREEVLRLMHERTQEIYRNKVSKRQIHYGEEIKALCGADRGRIKFTDMKLTLNKLEVTCQRCIHSLKLREGQP